MARKIRRMAQGMLWWALAIAVLSGAGGGTAAAFGPHHLMRDPSPEKLEAFPPLERSGVMMRDSLINGVGMYRRLYLPETVFPGSYEQEAVILAQSFVVLDWGAGAGAAYKKAMLFRPGDHSYFKKMTVCDGCLKDLPGEPNRSPAFFQPLRTRIGGRDYWVVNNRFFMGEGGSLAGTATLEIYDSEPLSPGVRPAAVWLFGAKDGRHGAWDFKRGLWPFKGKFYSVADFRTDGADDDRVTALALTPWEPKPEEILDGVTAMDLLARGYLKRAARNLTDLETALNETLLDWKARKFPELLQTRTGAALRDLTVRLEKAVLKLDLKARELKDAADEDARQAVGPGGGAKKAPAGALAAAHLLEQRKMVLMVLLGPLKKAAMQPGN